MGLFESNHVGQKEITVEELIKCGELYELQLTMIMDTKVMLDYTGDEASVGFTLHTAACPHFTLHMIVWRALP